MCVKEHPMQAGAVAIGVTALGVIAVKHFTKPKQAGLSGVNHKKKKRGKAKHRHHKQHKAPIALL